MRIDWWTLALQTVNVLVLIWILARFLFRPVADIIARRQQEANRILSDAAAAREEAAKVRADADSARAEIGKERERLIAEARQSAQAEKDNLLARSSQEIGKLRREAEAAIARDRAAAEQEIVARASDLSVEIARRLLGRLPPESVLSAFVDGLCGELRALPAEARERIKSGAADHAVEIVTAAALSAAEREQVRAALAQALGSDLPLEFRDDPKVVAGIELRGRNTIVRNSWRADLERIRKELSGDEQAVPT